jgi:glycosyltransferase involved in cell wall biosynthesis
MDQSRTPTVFFVMLMMMGKETVYQNLRRAIDARNDIRARWIVIETEPGEWFTRLPVIGASHSIRYGMAARVRVHAAVRTHGRPDAAFFNHLLPALFLGRFRKRVPCVDSLDVTPASLYADGQAYYQSPRHEMEGILGRLKRGWTGSIYRQSRRILPYSAYTKGSLVEDYGIDPSLITVSPPGVDLAFWHPQTGPSRPVRPFTILFVGNDFLRKGGDALLRAAGSEECRGMKFVIASNGTVGPIPSNVTVVRQAGRNSDALKELYSGSDIFLMPTRGDFGPTSAISEALAMGLPVLTHDIGGIGETVRDGIEGFHVTPDDPQSIVRSIVLLQSDQELRRRMSAAATKRAEELLDAAKYATTVVDYLTEAGSTDENADAGAGRYGEAEGRRA